MIDVIAVGASVTLLTEVAKTLLPEPHRARLAPYVSLVLSLVCTGLYVLSQPELPGRTDLWPLARDWFTVYATATGVYGGTKLARKEML